MLAALTAAAKFLAAPVGQFLSDRRKVKEKKLDVKLADLENRARLLRDTQKANSAWEIAQITQADKLARRFVLGAVSFPLIWGWFDPARANAYIEFISGIPEWYAALVGSIYNGEPLPAFEDIAKESVKRGWEAAADAVAVRVAAPCPGAGDVTDSGLTNTPPKNDGGTYITPVQVTLDGEPRHIMRGQRRGTAIRNALGVPADRVLSSRRTTADGVEDFDIEADTVYTVGEGRAYRTRPAGPGKPVPELKPVEKGDLPPTMAAECGAAEFAPRIGSPGPGPAMGPMTASALGQRLEAIDETLARIEGTALRAVDEAKRARTYAENIEAQGRKNEEAIHRAVDAATAAHEQAKSNGIELTRRTDLTNRDHAQEAVSVDVDGSPVELTPPGSYTGLELRRRFLVPEGRVLWTPTALGTLTTVADGVAIPLRNGQRFYTTPA